MNKIIYALVACLMLAGCSDKSFEKASKLMIEKCHEQKGVITMGISSNILVGNSVSVTCSVKVKD